jgi:DNA invertase Pin-like site-specific DNA recombinase
MFTIATAFAAFERALIRERVRAGMARAKSQGKHVGRPGAANGGWERIRPLVTNGEMSQRKAAKVLGVSRATIQRLLAQKMTCRGTPSAQAQARAEGPTDGRSYRGGPDANYRCIRRA